ncbi:hypothetical protein HYH03_008994 [Edaphochlamys debaryana]|uniref:MFS transporter n=1 Tax=Edaphochlamys debaryana TaxID=47281 RepID=A0A835XZF7_9CHLO|nr:hypothetical protein HYH03_008994 [Edaphochlamys debaryana]|eukprot:KAG2492840.1 hypothetical protein HYH03_008994 [Edaphochlamys debaryana]
MSHPRRLANIIGLSLGWCLMVSIVFIQLSTSTLAARAFGGDAVATLPAGIMMAGATLSATPGTLAMKRWGRRAVLLSSGVASVGGAALMVVAARWELLWLLVLGSVPLGVCNAQANNLRFAAVEFAWAGFEPHAMSLVVTGAVLAAVVGPEVARHTRTALPWPYVATYLYVVGLSAAYCVLVAVLEFGRTPDLVAEKAAQAAARAAAERKQPEGQGRGADEEAAGGGGATDGEGEGEESGDDESLERGVAAGTGVGGGVGARAEGAGPGQGPGQGGTPGRVVVAVEPHQAQAQARAQATPQAGPRGNSTAPAGPVVAVAPMEPAAAPAVRPVRELLLTWTYLVPITTAALAYAGMAGMMTASPLAIRDQSYSFEDATQVIQVHIISMFFPSLVTGEVIRILTDRGTALTGAVILVGGTATFFAGARLPVFYGANAVIGYGWNLAYVGASVMVSKTYSPVEKFLAQGVCDTVVLGALGIVTVVSGSLYGWLGWTGYTGVFMVVNGLSVVINLVAMANYVMRRSKARAAPVKSVR